MAGKYTTNRNCRVEYTFRYDGGRNVTLKLPLFRKYKAALFHYNRLGAIKAIQGYLVAEFMMKPYCRADHLEFKVYDHNREVPALRIAIEGTSDEAYSAALDRIQELMQ